MNSQNHLPQSTILRQYYIEKLLGEGGFGVTYLAKDIPFTNEDFKISGTYSNNNERWLPIGTNGKHPSLVFSTEMGTPFQIYKPRSRYAQQALIKSASM